jgi:hypothetical protein
MPLISRNNFYFDCLRLPLCAVVVQPTQRSDKIALDSTDRGLSSQVDLRSFSRSCVTAPVSAINSESPNYSAGVDCQLRFADQSDI